MKLNTNLHDDAISLAHVSDALNVHCSFVSEIIVQIV